MIRTDGIRTVSNAPARSVLHGTVDTPERVDFQVRNEGSVVLLWPISDEAVAWCDEHLPEDRISWGGAVVIEHRYAFDIVNGLAEDGLVGRAV